MDNTLRILQLEKKMADERLERALIQSKRENQQNLINTQISIITSLNKQAVMAAFFGGCND